MRRGAGWTLIGLELFSIVLPVVALTGCAKGCSQKKRTARDESTAAQAITPPAEVPAPSTQDAPPNTFPAAIREQDYGAAAQMIDGLSAAEQAPPEVRLARAKVALALKDVSTALTKVTGLAEEFPEFAPLTRDIILQCAKETQDITVLEHLLGPLGKVGHSENRFALLLAYEAGGQEHKALAGLGEMISSLRRETRPSSSERDLLARATKRRAQLLQSLEAKQTAAADYRWLALEAPTHPQAAHADQHYERLSGKRLTKLERKERAEELSEAGEVLLVEEELRRLGQAQGAALPPGEAEAILAWAVYASRTDYPRAAALFFSAAKLAPTQKSHHLYYSAKSLARAHDHRAAILRYEAVTQVPGQYADHASYNAARLHYIDGNFTAAIAGYDAYLRKYGGGAHRDSARYERAIALLANGSFDAARKELARLIAGERSDRVRARLLELEAVAAEGQDDLEAATALYAKAIELRPLSFAALLARARLLEKERPVPPMLVPLPKELVPHQPPLSPLLPDLVLRLDRVGLDDEAEQALRELEPDLRERFGDRGLEALCQLYGQIEFATRRYQVAQTAASWTTLAHEPLPNNRWQWECIYPTPHLDAVTRQAEQRLVPAAFIYGVMRQESAFRPRVRSPANAVGLMQIIPPTAAQIASEIGDEYQATRMVVPAVNVRYGAYYLRRLLDMFGGRTVLAAASYNAGPHAVESWLRGGERLSLDVFVAKIPYEETRNYVYRVMGNYARYQYLANGTLPEVDLSLPRGLKASAGAY